ncbi:NADP-dependent oxidoreductase domain-containing protein [Dioszegia hungarica]|uniref:NADP-dependent oxidoreductase domain-containing protein n=1 Tax=Dioszegia hungarica TaxID=4972 RepID=A0AA38HB41_9TREE|nr:NADP-dependent oxidoreductase domain-containing protein [Dioszegia hungarica]KAI9636259.1 NADP-dependent oxidoreductase domain-containing protein [Dioszegia hungarica]
MVRTLKFQDIDVAVPGFGAMGFSMSYGPAVESESRETLDKALSLGCTFWDSAAIYGKGHNEQLIGDWVKQNPGSRDKLFIASKCGLPFDGNGAADNSKEHIEEYIDQSIERLGFKPDLYYLHRIEPGRDLAESIGALQGLKEAGKCRYIGLSECNAETLRNACKIAHIDALQIEYSPWFTDHEQNGLIPAARELGVTIIAYSPLGKGILTGKFTSVDQFPEGDIRRTIPRFSEELLGKNMRIVDEFKKLAEKKGCSPGQLALAWVIAQGAIPIPGTKKAERLEENFGAREVDLDEEELAEIRKLVEEAKPEGARYNDAGMKRVGH